jgi:hypothetical protein
VARRLDRKQVVEGVYRRDAGALLDDCFSCLQKLGVVDWLGDVQGTAVQRERVPCVQSLRRYSLQTRCGIERMQALPALVWSDEALRRVVGCHAHQVRHGGCQRGAAPRQGPRTRGPLCPAALADTIVQLHLRDLEAVWKGVIRALAQQGGLTAQVTGSVDASAVETTAPYAGCGQVTRTRQITDTRGTVHASEGTVYGWKLIVLSDAGTKIPLAAKVVPLPAHATRSLRALVTQARTTLAGHARLPKVLFDTGVGEGVDLGWLAQHGSLWVVPATEHMAVTIDAQAQAAAGEDVTVGRRAHSGRQGKRAWTERLETEVVGITGLPTSDHYGTPEHRRQHTRRDFQPHLSHAVVVRTWKKRAYGPAGKPVFLTHAAVEPPLLPFDDSEARSLIEHGDIQESQQQGSVQPPPQNPGRAVRVHVLFTWRLFGLATASRWPCEPEERGREPVGWQRWRRQLREQTRDHVIVLAQDGYGIFPRAESSLLVGVNSKDRPPGIGTRQQILAKYGLTPYG